VGQLANYACMHGALTMQYVGASHANDGPASFHRPRVMYHRVLFERLFASGVVTWGEEVGGGTERSPRAAPVKRAAQRCQKIGLSFSVQKTVQKGTKNYSSLFFRLSQLKIESYFIQSV